MTVYVIRDGRLVEKRSVGNDRPISFPTPSVSRMTPFESPVTGKEISSWRERDADMKAANAFDVRDLGPGHQFRRDRATQQQEAKDARPDQSIWR
jgi:hypothetical protein